MINKLKQKLSKLGLEIKEDVEKVFSFTKAFFYKAFKDRNNINDFKGKIVNTLEKTNVKLSKYIDMAKAKKTNKEEQPQEAEKAEVVVKASPKKSEKKTTKKAEKKNEETKKTVAKKDAKNTKKTEKKESAVVKKATKTAKKPATKKAEKPSTEKASKPATKKTTKKTIKKAE